MNEARAALVAPRGQSITHVVRETVERMILDGKLKAGAHISEAALSAELGVSRGPIREACRALVENGLLIAHANRGFFVRQLTLKEVIDVYDVRTALARLAGRTLAARIKREQYGALAALVSEMDEANREWNFEEFYRLNLTFHDRIIEFSGNIKLKSIHAGLVNELHIFRRRGLIPGENTRNSNEEHKTILAALSERDVDASGEQMERHVILGKGRFLDALGWDMQ